ncbi:hypothetical protein Anae109_1333 [Anaeromyxobacter sp. Fw109-5]|nr:hypothetical protein Anae109_1333 [Anaeromyxobacter sp. Fw109-5]
MVRYAAPGDEVAQVLLGQHLAEQLDGGDAKAAIPKRALEAGEPAQHPHRLDASPGRALAQVEHLQAIRPERGVPGVHVRAAAIEHLEVEEELDLDVALLACELAQALGEEGRVEGGRGDRGHGAPPVHPS